MRTYPTLKVDSINRSDDWPLAFPTIYADRGLSLAVTRTQEFQTQSVERDANCLQYAYMMSVNMTTLRATTFVDGKKTLERTSYAGSVNIFQPGSTLRCIFRGHLDACIMALPIELLSAILEEAELSGGRHGEEGASFVQDRGLLVLFHLFQIALSVGFHTQSHLSTVSKRIVRDTPVRRRVDSRVHSEKRFVGTSSKPTVVEEEDERKNERQA